MSEKKVLQALARAILERRFKSVGKTEIRQKLGDTIDILILQERLLGSLALSKSMGPVVFEVGRKVSTYLLSQASSFLLSLPGYRDFADARNLEEARRSVFFKVLQERFKSDHFGLIKLTEFQKDNLAVFQIEECAECYGIGNMGMNVCYYGGGSIAGALEFLLTRNVAFVESKCYAKGDSCCEFRYRMI